MLFVLLLIIPSHVDLVIQNLINEPANENRRNKHQSMTIRQLKSQIDQLPDIQWDALLHYLLGTPNVNITYEGNQSYFTCTSLYVYVKNSNFFAINETAIRYDSKPQSRMLIDQCLFSDCQSWEEDGGAIFFYPEGICILSNVCGIKCQTAKEYVGQFFFICFVVNYNKFLDLGECKAAPESWDNITPIIPSSDNSLQNEKNTLLANVTKQSSRFLQYLFAMSLLPVDEKEYFFYSV